MIEVVEMAPNNVASGIREKRPGGETERRASVSSIRSPLKALRSLSIGSQMSQMSLSSEADGLPSISRQRRPRLSKIRSPDIISEKSSIRHSREFSEDCTESERSAISTRTTTPSGTGSRGTSISGDFGAIKHGPLQAENSLLKTKKEYLVLTPIALLKFKHRQAAAERFPQLSSPRSAVEIDSPLDLNSSSKVDIPCPVVQVPLEKIVTVFSDEGTKPSFGIEVWWKDIEADSSFTNLELNFHLPEDRDDWMKQIRYAARQRTRAVSEDLTPSRLESQLYQILEERHPNQVDTKLDVFPVVPRGLYAQMISNPEDTNKGKREVSTDYLALTKHLCILAQFPEAHSGQRTTPSLVQYGLVTLTRVKASLVDERFELIFRIPMKRSCRLELSSKYHRSIVARLFRADTYLKPAWPLWTRQDTFRVDGETQQISLPEGEDYGGFRRTLEAFIEGYHCAAVTWEVHWKGVRYPPEFRLLPEPKRTRHTAHQLLAVFRALRFNDFFKSLSFHGVDLSALSGLFDNVGRLESTVWLSRTGKLNLTPDEFEVLQTSSILFQEVVALLLGSESVRHIDFGNVSSQEIRQVPAAAPMTATARRTGSEIMAPITFLFRSLQTRCRSVVMNGNPIGAMDILELYRASMERPAVIRCLSFSKCQLEQDGLSSLWDSIDLQRQSLEIIEVANNRGRTEAAKVAETLRDAPKVRRLDLANALKGSLEGPLLWPWDESANARPWRLEELDLSGWQINFDTVTTLLAYMQNNESVNLRRLALNNCRISGDVATTILCGIGSGRDINLQLSGNPLELGSLDWIDLIHGDETPRMLSLDMIHFEYESNFNRLITALTHNSTIEDLSLVGTGASSRVSPKTSKLLSYLFEKNSTMRFLDLSGYSGKIEDGHMGLGLSGAVRGLEHNRSMRSLRLMNHDLGATEDMTELCRTIAANEGLCMLDVRNNNFSYHQYAKIVAALDSNHQIVSFPLSKADRDYAIERERRALTKTTRRTSKLFSKSKTKTESMPVDPALLKRVRKQWDADSTKIADIIDRNRRDPANLLRCQELDPDWLDTWDDPGLSEWLHSAGLAAGADDAAKGKEPMYAYSPTAASPISPTTSGFSSTPRQFSYGSVVVRSASGTAPIIDEEGVQGGFARFEDSPTEIDATSSRDASPTSQPSIPERKASGSGLGNGRPQDEAVWV